MSQLATKLLFITCQSMSTETQACDKLSQALYKTTPVYFRQIDNMEQELSNYITPELSIAFSVINAINKKEVKITIVNIKF